MGETKVEHLSFQLGFRGGKGSEETQVELVVVEARVGVKEKATQRARSSRGVGGTPEEETWGGGQRRAEERRSEWRIGYGRGDGDLLERKGDNENESGGVSVERGRGRERER